MKRVIFVGAGVVTAALGVSVPASAQTSPVPQNATVLFVSSQRISSESADGRAGQVRVQTVQRERAAGVREKQRAHEATRQQLATAAPEDRPALQRQEQEQRSDLERSALQAQVEVQNLQREITLDLQAKVRAVLDELVKGTAVQVVLQLESAVVWAAPGHDVTTVVIERLNAGTGDVPARSR